MIHTKKDIWKKIKERDFNFSLKAELFALIEEHLNRIDFVTDHVGVRDFLCITEQATNFTANFFVGINVGCEKSHSYKENLNLFLYKYNANPSKALQLLEEFFKTTERTLYVAIGFKESQVVNQEAFTAELLNGKYSCQEEVFKKLREYPDWYADYAKDPVELSFLTVKTEGYIKNVLRPLEKAKLKGQLNSVLEKEKLTRTDKALLTTLAIHLAQ